MPVQAISHQASAAATLAAGGKASALRNLPKGEQIKAAAGQFEAIILRQLLQDSVGKIMGKGPTADTYGYLLTDTLANKLTEGGGLGLSGMLAKQLTPRGNVDDVAGTNDLP
jgi:flagellar protein FlgJ